MSCYGCIFKGQYEDMGVRCDACKLQDYLPDAINACDNSENCLHRVTLEEAKKKLLSSDVVEVVRCKDCKYYTEHYQDTYGEYGRCDHPQQNYEIECFDMWVETDPDDYCSYGERKEQ